MKPDPLKPPCVKCGRPTGYAAFDGKKIVPCCKRICTPPKPPADTDRIDIIARADRITVRPDGRVVVVVHEGEPVPKERARGGMHGHYTPSRTRAAESALALVIKAALRGKRFDGNVAVVAVFYRSTLRRVDADNLLKTAMDAATKAGAWVDDSQATSMAAWVELDRERPRTVLAIAEADSTMERAAKPKKGRAA